MNPTQQWNANDLSPGTPVYDWHGKSLGTLSAADANMLKIDAAGGTYEIPADKVQHVSASGITLAEDVKSFEDFRAT